MSAPEATGPLLHVLGAGSILPRAGHGCAGYALEPVPGGPLTLLDLGPGSLRRLAEAGLDLERVRRVVFSHYHPDHCLDLYALAFARANPALAGPGPLDLVGPPGLARLAAEPPGLLAPHTRIEENGPGCTLHEVQLDADGRGGLEADGLVLRCVRNGHTRTLVALSWRVELPGGLSLGYTGDTNDDPHLAQHFRGVDLLLAECSFSDAHAVPNHLTPRTAAALARDAGVGKLVLSHFYPDLDPEDARRAAAEVYGGPIEAARDGSRHSLAP